MKSGVQLQSKPPMNSQPCTHVTLVLETDDTGRYLTGRYHCMDCDKDFARKKVLALVKAAKYRPKKFRQVMR